MFFNFYLRNNSLQGISLHHKTRCTGHNPIPSQHRGETHIYLNENTLELSVVTPAVFDLPVLTTAPHQCVYIIVVDFNYKKLLNYF